MRVLYDRRRDATRESDRNTNSDGFAAVTNHFPITSI
jgi:hypothetical protein